MRGVFRVAGGVVLGGAVVLWLLGFDVVGRIRDAVPGLHRAADQTIPADHGTEPTGTAELRTLIAALDSRIRAIDPHAGPAGSLAALERRVTAIDRRLAELAARPVAGNGSAVADQLARLEAQVQALGTSAVAGFDTSGLEAQMIDLNTRIAEIAARPGVSGDTTLLGAEIASIRETVEALAARSGAGLGELHDAIAALDAKVSGIADGDGVDPAGLRAALAAIDARLAEVAARPSAPPELASIGDRLAVVEAGIDRLAGRPEPRLDTTELQAQIGSLAGRIADLAARTPPAFDAAPLETRLGSLEDAVSALAARPAPTLDTSPLQERIAALEAAVGALAARPAPSVDFGPVREQIAALDRRLADIARDPAQAADIKVLRAELGTAVSTLAAQIGALAAALPPETDLAPLAEQVGRLEGLVGTIADRPLAPPVDEFRERIAALDRSLLELADRPGADLSGVEARIAALEARIAGIAARPVPDFGGIESRLGTIEAATADIAARLPEGTPGEAPAAQPVVPQQPEPGTGDIAALPPVEVLAAGEAWIQVTDRGRVIFEGTLLPGAAYAVPADAVAPRLRAGNAGAVFIRIGAQAFGPVGQPRRVVRDLSLLPGDVLSGMTEADPAALPPAR